MVRSTTTVKEVKEKLEKKGGIPAAKQKLRTRGGKFLLHQDLSLKESCVGRQATLVMCPLMSWKPNCHMFFFGLIWNILFYICLSDALYMKVLPFNVESILNQCEQTRENIANSKWTHEFVEISALDESNKGELTFTGFHLSMSFLCH